MPFTRRQWLVLIVLALGVRLGVLGGLYTHPGFFDPNYVTDHWDHISHNVIAGNGFSWTEDGSVPTLTRGPGYVGFLTVLTLLTHENLFAMRVLYLLVDVVLVLLVARLSYEVIASRKGALLAGVVYAMYPIPAWHIVKLSPDAFFSFVLISTMLLFLTTMQRHGPAPRYRRVVAAGVLLGLAILTKKTALIAAPAWLLIALWSRRFERAAWLRAVVYAMAAALVVAPWLYRNYRVAGRPAPLQTMTWHVFWYGEFVDREGGRVESADFENRAVDFLGSLAGEHPYRISHELTPQEDLDREAKLKALALQYIRENPGAMAAKMARNLIRFWYRTETGRMGRYTGTMGATLFLLMLIGVGSLVVSHRFNERAATLLATIVVFQLAYAPVLSHIRYMIPVSPCVSIFGGYGLYRVWEWLHHHPPRGYLSSMRARWRPIPH
jgi:hypothetical protein